MRVAQVIELTASQRAKLLRMSKARSSSIRTRERAKIILLAAEGLQNKEISRRHRAEREEGRALAETFRAGRYRSHP